MPEMACKPSLTYPSQSYAFPPSPPLPRLARRLRIPRRGRVAHPSTSGEMLDLRTAMHSENFRRRALLGTLAILVVAAGSLAALRPRVQFEKRGHLYCIEDAGYLYTFDAAWRTETLFHDADGDGLRTPVARPEGALLTRLRGELLRRLKVEGLAGVPLEGVEEMDAIRSLGYI